MDRYPRLIAVTPTEPLVLVVTFENGVTKRYDCSPLLRLPAFEPLSDPGFFRLVKVDPGGYGVSWSDDVDLAEAELWDHGVGDEVVAHP